MYGKNKPYKSKEFLRFAKQQVGPCCLCSSKPGNELHHWGADGGMGMKPGDFYVARVCTDCHNRHGQKRRALVKNQKFAVLEAFIDDSQKLHVAYMKHLEAQLSSNGWKKLFNKLIESSDDCARTKAIEMGIEYAPEDTETFVEEFLEFSQQRCANIINFLAEPLAEIANYSNDEAKTLSAKFVANQALNRAGLEKLIK